MSPPLTDEELAAIERDAAGPCYECNVDAWGPRIFAELRAARAKVERLLTQDGDNEQLSRFVAEWHQRAVTAEAEVERLRVERDTWRTASLALTESNTLFAAEVERLRKKVTGCSGSCRLP